MHSQTMHVCDIDTRCSAVRREAKAIHDECRCSELRDIAALRMDGWMDGCPRGSKPCNIELHTIKYCGIMSKGMPRRRGREFGFRSGTTAQQP